MVWHFELTCPETLAARGISLAIESEGDVPALRVLYLRHRWPEFAMLPLADEQKAALLDTQFTIQRQQYRARHPDHGFYVLACDGAVIGRLMLGLGEGAIAILDILVDPDWRGRGVGAAVLAAVAERARASARAVTLHVDKGNPALRLYQRTGFRIVGDAGLAHAMRFDPVAARPPA